jgi:hypothetical protein
VNWRAPAAVLVAIPLLAALRFTTPSYAELTGPLDRAGEIGVTVEARNFAAKVGEARFARRIKARVISRPVERDTSGVWAVVPVEVWATEETATLMGATWRGPSGRRYAQSARLESAKPIVTGKPLQPGLPRRGVMIFEMPEDEATGGRLLLSVSPDPRLDSRLVFAPAETARRVEDVLDVDDGDLWGG